MFDDDDAGNYVAAGGDLCPAGEFPCCQDSTNRQVSGCAGP
jgi:hypothetical protein